MVYFKQCPAILLIASLVFCGRFQGNDAHAGRKKRTIGGSGFARGQFPFLALLRATMVTRRFLGIPVDHSHIYCGGVLITDQWLLSAAHCFGDVRGARDPDIWEARLGTIRLRAGVREHLLDIVGRITSINDLRQWEIDVDRIVVHPAYNSTELLSHDIALVKLERRIPRRGNSTRIGKIALPRPSRRTFPSAEEECVTMGWGCNSPGQGPSDQASQISMPIRPPYTCTYHYGLPSMNRRLCAGHTGAGIGVCSGDSGSPLVCRRGSGDYKLAGIVSLTSRNNPQSFPAVFSAVRDYIPWIQYVLGEDRDQLSLV